jgi:hypothetical protein
MSQWRKRGDSYDPSDKQPHRSEIVRCCIRGYKKLDHRVVVGEFKEREALNLVMMGKGNQPAFGRSRCFTL